MTPLRLRVWPGVAAATIQWVMFYGVPLVLPDSILVAFAGGILGAVAVLAWWLFFSRVPIPERIGAVALIAVALAFLPRVPSVLHPSIAGGMMGMMFPIHALPLVCGALVVWAVAAQRMPVSARRAALAGTILCACGILALFRTDGITGQGRSQFAWRWAPTPEQKLLTRAEMQPAPFPAPVVSIPVPPRRVPADVRPAEWPGFRGPLRDSRVSGLRINSDWAASPPVLLWRRPVGPGWSSFAIGNGLVYTQEQRGQSELVVCYRLNTGEPVWRHSTQARFWESNAGAGPRGTPTLSNGRVYALGATGILNALDAATGSTLWTRDAAGDTGTRQPTWGFASSPLAIRDLVIVAASGRLAAYDTASGQPKWLGPMVKGSYSSPHLLTIDGVEQVLLLTNAGATSVRPEDGKVLWRHEWPGNTMLQPTMSPDGGVLITTGSAAGGVGTRRLAVSRKSSGWSVEESWTSNGLKPYFNDLVAHQGYAYGFDGGILSCIDLKDGTRKWKGGRYGHGQMVLLAEQGLLLVISEEGELALVEASPEKFSEVAKVPAIEGKTWNHPALSGTTLLVRNGQEMAAFRLARAAD